MNIVVVEDQEFVRETLVQACDEAGYPVVAAVGDGAAAADAILRHRPDLVVLDLELPIADGFAVIASARSALPEIKFLVVSAFSDPITVGRLDRLAIQGFVDKNSSGQTAFVTALKAIAAGQPKFSPAYINARQALRAGSFVLEKMLTDQQRRVLTLMGDLRTDCEIADALHVSIRTIEAHRAHLRELTGIEDRAQMVRFAVTHGYRSNLARGVSLS